MLGRIVEIAEDDRFLSVYRGFLVVSERQCEVARIPLDDITALIGNAHGLAYSNNVLVNLAERGAPFVICARNHKPVSILWPVDSHHEQAGRMRAQAAARRSVKKRLWQQLVRRKIAEQANVLAAFDRSDKILRRLVDSVRSGDTSNIEAQAARHYWRALFGPSFRRDPDGDGLNALLNYGYAVLRATCARAILAAGLHPSLGLFHRSGGNAFQLVDDVMEPYRPVVDATVYALAQNRTDKVDKSTKRLLAMTMYFNRVTRDGVTPLTRCIQLTAASIAQAYSKSEPQIWFPDQLTATEIRTLPLETDAHARETTVGLQADVANSDV